jgi:NAD+ kinase
MIHSPHSYLLQLKNVGVLLSDPLQQEETGHQICRLLNVHNIQADLLDWDSDAPNSLDMLITVGGDGTVLYALGHFPNCPVLAINFGNVGFLTASNREDLGTALQQVTSGQYVISHRSMICCEHPNGQLHAVNEIVLKGTTRMLTVDMSINRKNIRRIRGDGVIVGTATGSTAYLMAAGSPIVMPELRCMIITGLNEYDFRSRPLVVTHDSVVCLGVSTETRETDMFLAADGGEKIPLQLEDEIIIRESDRQAKLIFPDSNYFFHNLSSRLSW